MASNFNEFVGRDEFEYPEDIDNSVIELAKEIRNRIDRPMFFSKVNGIVTSPGRDARYMREESKDFSLHRVGINHEASKKLGKAVIDENFFCRAIDFHLKTNDFDEYMEMADIVSSVVGCGGVGLYPAWNKAGFHIDTRLSIHPGAYARWFDMGNKDYVYSSHVWYNQNVENARKKFSHKWFK